MRDGSLVKVSGDPRVYVVTNGHAEHIVNESLFLACGFKWENVRTVSQTVLDSVLVVDSNGASTNLSSNAILAVDEHFAISSPAVADPIPPTGYIQEPHADLTGGTAFRSSWQAEDFASGIASAYLEYTLDDWDSSAPVSLENLMTLPYDNTINNPIAVFDWQVPDVDTDAAGFRLLLTDLAGNFGVVYSSRFAIVSTSSGGACASLSAPLLGDPGVTALTPNVTVTWSTVAGAESYELQEDTSPSFEAPSTHTVALASLTIGGHSNGSYYYRVRAVSDCGESSWSSTVDIDVDVNQAPSVPSSPSPGDRATGVSRTPTLSFAGSDPEGTVEFAVKMGTSPSTLSFVLPWGASSEYPVTSPLAPGSEYFWRALTRDSEHLITEGPVWSFTTAYSWPDLEASLDVTGDVSPGGTVALALTVTNRGSYDSEPCAARFYYSNEPDGRDVLLGPAMTLVPALASGASALLTIDVSLDALTAGTSYAVAVIDSATYFEEGELANNVSSFPLEYVDDNSPTITWSALRYGIGPSGNQYQTGHEYQIAFGVEDDIGVGCNTADIDWSVDAGVSWSSIASGLSCNRQSPTNALAWTIPSDATLTADARIRVRVLDDVGNSGVGFIGPFEIIDGSGPEVTLTSPNGGEVWALGSSKTISWTATSPASIAQIRLYLHFGDRVEYIGSITGSDPGQYAWTIPTSVFYATKEAHVRIRVIDALGNEAEDQSNGEFELSDPSAPPPAPWTTPELLTNVGTCGVAYCTVDHQQPKLAVDSQGDVHLAYVYVQDDFRDGLDQTRYLTARIMYRKKTGAVWGEPEPAASFPEQHGDASGRGLHYVDGLEIAVDSENQPTISWAWRGSTNTEPSNPFDSDVYATRKAGESWEAAVNLSGNTTYSSADTELVISGDDTAYVFWVDGRTWNPSTSSWSGQKRLYYRSRAYGTSTWSASSTTLDDGSFSAVDVVRGKGGYPHLVYVANSGLLMQSTNDGSAFLSPIAASGCTYSAAPDAPSAQALVTGEVDTTVRVYGDSTEYVHSFFDGDPPTACSTAVVAGEERSLGTDQLLRHDASGLPTLAWIEQGSPNAVMFRRLAARPDAWSPATRMSLASQHAQDYSLAFAVGPTDVAHVAWITYSNGHGEVHYNHANITLDTEAPNVSVLAPVAGEALSAGAVTTIAWTATDNVGPTGYDIYYSTDQGATLTPIATIDDPTASEVLWTPPNAVEPEVLVMVVARDAAGNEGSASSGTFRLVDTQSCAAAIQSPNGGETFVPGELVTVSWAVSDDIGIADASVYYSNDDGATWKVIAENLASSGSFDWTAPDARSSRYRVLVVATDLAGNTCTDQSDTAFAVLPDNTPPAKAFGPIPGAGASDVAPDGVILEWNVADADGDALTYDVYLGIALPLGVDDLVAASLSETTLDVGVLAPETTYYWQVTSSDGVASTAGSSWEFTTRAGALTAPASLAAVAVPAGGIELS